MEGHAVEVQLQDSLINDYSSSDAKKLVNSTTLLVEFCVRWLFIAIYCIIKVSIFKMAFSLQTDTYTFFSEATGLLELRSVMCMDSHQLPKTMR